MDRSRSWQHAGQSPDGVMKSASQIGFVAPSYLRKFIDDYLALRHYELTDANRKVVALGIERYGSGNLVLPSELMVFLDNLYREKST